MKKHLRLIKTLLVAAGLGTGANAWGQTTAFSQDFTAVGESTTPSDYGFAAGTCNGYQSATVSDGKFSSAVGDNTNGASQNNYTDHTATFSAIGTGNIITFTCTWMPGGATGNGKSSIALTDAEGNMVLKLQKGNGGSTGQYHMYVNDTDVHSTTKLGSGNNSDVYTVSATINMSTQKITALTIGSIYTLSEPVAFTATSVSKFNIYNKNKANWVNTATLDNVSITYEAAAASTATVTIEYEDTEGNDLTSLKADVVSTEEVGTNISDLLTAVLKESFYNGDASKKYVYSTYTCSDETVPVDGTTVTLKFVPYDKYTYTVSSSLGTELKAGFVYADAPTTTVPYPRYELSGTDLYEAEKNSNSDYWRKTYTITSDGQAETITYTKSLENIVSYQEGEDIASLTRTERTDYSFHIRCSNGAAGYPANTTANKIITLPAGCYKMYTSVWGNSTHSFTFKKGDENLLVINCNGNIQDVNVSFTLTGSTDITVTASYNTSNRGVDYVFFQEVNSVSGTIASKNFSSLASAYGLDFSSATGLTAAYVVTNITKDAVTLTSVNELPANSGVILKGEAGAAYSIPVKADAAYEGTNKLYAAVEAYNCAANEVYILQGGLFHLVTAASTVPAGKAYLKATDVPKEARSLGFLFGDDETNGINAVSSNQKGSEFYNLQGLRVDAPKKGMYIVNGKKVIIK